MNKESCCLLSRSENAATMVAVAVLIMKVAESYFSVGNGLIDFLTNLFRIVV